MAAPHSTLFRAALRLPKADATWLIVEGEYDGDDGQPRAAVLVVDAADGTVRADHRSAGPSDALLFGALHKAMHQPPPPARPARPSALEVEDSGTAHLLRKPLRLLGVRVGVAVDFSAGEEVWQRVFGHDIDDSLLPPEAEVTLSPEVPAWLRAKLPVDAGEDVHRLAAAGAPWVVVWAAAAEVERCRTTLAELVELELDAGEAPRDDDADGGVERAPRVGAWRPAAREGGGDGGGGGAGRDAPPALLALDRAGRPGVLCWTAPPEVRASFEAATVASRRRVLVVLAERTVERPPPAMAGLRGAWMLRLR